MRKKKGKQQEKIERHFAHLRFNFLFFFFPPLSQLPFGSVSFVSISPFFLHIQRVCGGVTTVRAWENEKNSFSDGSTYRTPTAEWWKKKVSNEVPLNCSLPFLSSEALFLFFLGLGKCTGYY